MKSAFKVLTTISAIGFSLNFLWRLILHFHLFGVDGFLQTLSTNPLWRELYYNAFVWLITGCIILALVAFLITSDGDTPVNKQFKKYTLSLSVLCCVILFVAVWYSLRNIGSHLHMLWPPYWLDMILQAAVIVWLCLLTHQTSIGHLSKPLKMALVCGIVLLAVPLVLQLVSGFTYLLEGHICGLHSTLLYTWLRFFVPTLLLCCYSIELQKQ